MIKEVIQVPAPTEVVEPIPVRIGSLCFYNSRGEILIRAYMSEPEAHTNAQVYGLAYLFTEANELDHYIGEGDEVLDRPALELTLDGMTLKGVPEGATVVIEGTEYIVDGSDIELAFSHPGTFKLDVRSFPYKDAEIEVTYET